MATVASDNPFPKIIGVEQGSNPATPSAGQRKLYPKADGWYDIDDAGAVTGPFGTGSGGGGTTGEVLLAHVECGRTTNGSTSYGTTWTTVTENSVPLTATITVPASGVLRVEALIVGIGSGALTHGRLYDGSAAITGTARLISASSASGTGNPSVSKWRLSGLTPGASQTVAFQVRSASSTVGFLSGPAGTDTEYGPHALQVYASS